MRSILIAILLFSGYICSAQQEKYVDNGQISLAVGSQQGSASIDYFHLWRLGNARNVELGIGGRLTSYFGNSQYYSSAPASLAINETSVDSLLIKDPQVNALSLAFNLGYLITDKIGIGFSIDVIGFSFGAEQNGTYIVEQQALATTAKPTSFNILLVGNNDQGSLNSEFYARYFFSEKIALKVAYQFLFTEYTAITEVQQVPEPNDRFRNKSSLLSLGITKTF